MDPHLKGILEYSVAMASGSTPILGETGGWSPGGRTPPGAELGRTLPPLRCRGPEKNSGLEELQDTITYAIYDPV